MLLHDVNRFERRSFYVLIANNGRQYILHFVLEGQAYRAKALTLGLKLTPECLPKSFDMRCRSLRRKAYSSWSTWTTCWYSQRRNQRSRNYRKSRAATDQTGMVDKMGKISTQPISSARMARPSNRFNRTDDQAFVEQSAKPLAKRAKRVNQVTSERSFDFKGNSLVSVKIKLLREAIE